MGFSEAMASIGVVEDGSAATLGDDEAKGDGEMEDDEEEGDKEELRFDKEELGTPRSVGEEDDTSRWPKEDDTVAGTAGCDGQG